MPILDRFLPVFDVRERFEVTVNAPADLVMKVAEQFDITSVPIVRAIFWLRAKALRSKEAYRGPTGIVASTRAMGWGELWEAPSREIVMGARTKPWEPDPKFEAILATDFPDWCEPGFVKIAWTLEAIPLDDTRCIHASETRALATDPTSRKRFRRYWFFVKWGVYAIRWFAMPAVRREAERHFRARTPDPHQAGHLS